jgi:hypothetical protein
VDRTDLSSKQYLELISKVKARFSVNADWFQLVSAQTGMVRKIDSEDLLLSLVSEI